ncbi:MAG: IPT/TIG domain-containing protein [Polyangiaceae bacterium]
MRRPLLTAACLALTVGGAACFSTGQAVTPPETDASLPPPPTSLDDGDGGNLTVRSDVDVGDPFALLGLTPSHGPWTGGTRTTLRGRGFPSTLRVFVGDAELAATDVVASDPLRAAVVMPEHAPGPVDVRIRDDKTAKERILPAGFVYDTFVVEPSSGSTTGGTRIALRGNGTAWTSGTSVKIAGADCTDLRIVDPTRIECTTPAHAAGAADVTVDVPASTLLQVRDAFTYADSVDGFRGGLSGGILDGKLRVLVLDSFAGVPLPGARVILGSGPSPVTKTTSAAGIADFSDENLRGKVTVTITAQCHQPVTYVDVPVDMVTSYVGPILDPACGQGDPPSIAGGATRNASEVTGELIFPGGVEFTRGSWAIVPAPVRPSERRVAYVFAAAGSPSSGFWLPDVTAAVTEDSAGQRGYGYAYSTFPGALTLYALAGIEDRTGATPRFVPYVMGYARGIAVDAGKRTEGIDIPMNIPLDHTLRLAPTVPPSGPRGPDRFSAYFGVSLGQSAFAIFPFGTTSTPLPVADLVSVVGVPALAGALANESYTIGASAVSNTQSGAPASYVGRIRTRDTDAPVSISGFLPVPVVLEPRSTSWSGTTVKFQASGPIDLVKLEIASGGGLVTWSVHAPGSVREFTLPDLRSLPPLFGIVPGTVQATLSVARIDGFDYAKLRSGQTNAGGWSAYAVDQLYATY